jgi:D-lactate dehydrogenase (cytochrome)
MIVKDRREEFQDYLEDTSNLRGEADTLFFPQTEREVSSLVRECVEGGVNFTLSAGKTGTTGGCVPLGGAVISLEKLNKIIDIDEQKNIVHLQGGVSLQQLDEQAGKYGLTLRAAPTESLAFIGGAVATGASGVRGFGYGSIRNYVAALEVVLPRGEMLKIRRGRSFAEGRAFDFGDRGKRFKFRLPSYVMPQVKTQAGYFVKEGMDLIDLFIGSEGTLGIIIACEINLSKVPFNMLDGLVFFTEERAALDFTDRIKELKTAGALGPASLEFFDSNSLAMLKAEYSLIPPSAVAAVYFEQEVRDEADYNFLIEKWAGLIEENGASLDNSILADNAKDRRQIFDFRHKLPQMINEYLRRAKQVKVAADIAVPDGYFRPMYNFYKKTAREAGIDYVNFGHIGESHLHFNFLPRTEAQSRRAKQMISILCREAVTRGGTVSAEHGIGKIKKPYLALMYTEDEIREMAAVKKYFDPACRLNLDNIFPKETLYNL